VNDRRVLDAAASALRRLPPNARAGHLARKLEDMAKREDERCPKCGHDAALHCTRCGETWYSERN
jgi:ribosomal protein S27AE